MTKRSLVAAMATLALPAVTMAAPSFSALVGGSNSQVIDIGGAATTPGTVSLSIQGVLNSDNLLIGGWQHSLKASNPALWNYGTAPVVSVNPNNVDTVVADDPATDFSASDLAFNGTSANGALPGNQGGEISIFKSQGEVGPYNNVHIETIKVVSKAPLAKGDYTFSFGDSGQGFIMISSQADGGAANFGQGGVFTLSVVPEPASALLLLGALPFLRRRKVS